MQFGRNGANELAEHELEPVARAGPLRSRGRRGELLRGGAVSAAAVGGGPQPLPQVGKDVQQHVVVARADGVVDAPLH